MKISRRKILTAFLLFAATGYGGSEILKRAGAPPGWKTERWEAGFGSWSSGGFGVAYYITMPEHYHFLQKW